MTETTTETTRVTGTMTAYVDSLTEKHYAPEEYGSYRLTDCCAHDSTYMDDGKGAEDLCCKGCYHVVPLGQGDGSEVRGR